MVFNGYRFAAPKGWHERLDGLITCSRSCNGKAVRTTPRPDQMVRQAPTS